MIAFASSGLTVFWIFVTVLVVAPVVRTIGSVFF